MQETLISETVKQFNGDVPVQLNNLFASCMGKLEYIKLKHNRSLKIKSDEIAFLISAAEKTEK